MKEKISDPIVAEIRAVREKHAAQFDYDLGKIFADIKKRQELSGRDYVKYPGRQSINNRKSH